MDFWIKTLMALNVFMYRLTGGLMGGRMSGQNVLLLHTVGRKSGAQRITPVNFFRDGENYVLVASNWGKPGNPAWYFNLLQQPDARIQVKRRTYQVRARPAAEGEYGRLWDLVTGRNPFYARYQAQTKRQIPIVILTII